jgi:hypothetical protein
VDETCIHHYAPGNKYQSVHWKHLIFPSQVQYSTIGGKSDVDKPKGAFYSEHSGTESWKEGDRI